MMSSLSSLMMSSLSSLIMSSLLSSPATGSCWTPPPWASLHGVSSKHLGFFMGLFYRSFVNGSEFIEIRSSWWRLWGSWGDRWTSSTLRYPWSETSGTGRSRSWRMLAGSADLFSLLDHHHMYFYIPSSWKTFTIIWKAKKHDKNVFVLQSVVTADSGACSIRRRKFRLLMVKAPVSWWSNPGRSLYWSY